MTNATTDGKNVGKRTEAKRQEAHALLDELFDHAAKGKRHGKVGVEVSFQDGVAQHVREVTNFVRE